MWARTLYSQLSYLAQPVDTAHIHIFNDRLNDTEYDVKERV